MSKLDRREFGQLIGGGGLIATNTVLFGNMVIAKEDRVRRNEA
jgi:hypothetical protein